MFQLLLLIISYVALLLLLMPVTTAGVISTAIALILGIGLIVYKKLHKTALHINKQRFLIPVVFLLAACFGLAFYIRWPLSSKIRAIATMLHIQVETLLLIGALVLSCLSVYFLYAVLQTLVKKASFTDTKHALAENLVSCFVASAVTVILAQVMVGALAFSMGYLNFIWGVLIVLVVILFIYALLGRLTPSILFGSSIFMLISTISAYVYKFRERLFEPADVFSAGTAINVAENYSLFPIPLGILIGWGIFTALLIVLRYSLHNSNAKLAAKTRYVILVICVICSVAISLYASNLKTYHWHNDGARFNGYILDFVSKFKEISVDEPDNYNIEAIAKLADQYAEDSYKQGSKPVTPPHIIVIMDEAFSDLSVVGKFSTNTEVMPFISSLEENTISGYTLTSVYGGNTANSEYEFLTGNSMAWLSPNTVPFQQYIRTASYSMVSHLKSSYNYKCVAMHPYHSSGWNRPAAYGNLGFDECYFVEDFPQKNYVRKFISDQEMFEFLIETYEAQKEEPMFLFGVSMQNHGNYTYSGENYTQHISLNDYGDEFPEAEQYLSLIHETDKAVEYLITYFQSVDEDVIIVFFGDHQPTMADSFYKAIGGETEGSLDNRQKLYKVPFFIWANYNIEEEYIDCTSLNYLSSYVYDAAGITLPPYNQFLKDMEANIPSINANGFYSLDAGRYLSFDESNEEELRWLEMYEALQYNNIFDNSYRNESLFPAYW